MGGDEPDAPEDSHPCAHVFANKITEQYVWDCSQRDIDRAYLEGVADVQRQEMDAKMDQTEMIFDWVEMGASLAAAAIGAIPWGSYAVPATEGSESAVEGVEDAIQGGNRLVLVR